MDFNLDDSMKAQQHLVKLVVQKTLKKYNVGKMKENLTEAERGEVRESIQALSNQVEVLLKGMQNNSDKKERSAGKKKKR